MHSANNIQEIGLHVKTFRDQKSLTQEELAKAIGISRDPIAKLEQGRKFPSIEILKKIANYLGIPEDMICPSNPLTQNRLKFEDIVSELIGMIVNTRGLNEDELHVLEETINDLFGRKEFEKQKYDILNKCMIFYGIEIISTVFFDKYLSNAFSDLESFEKRVKEFQSDAIRLYSTFREAFLDLNACKNMDDKLSNIKAKESNHKREYTERTEWISIEKIANNDLQYLGYISAEKVKKEHDERKEISDFLIAIAEEIEKNSGYDIKSDSKYTESKLKKMDSLLRKFNASFQHTFISSLFSPTASELKKEAKLLAPTESEITKMKEMQNKAFKNLTNYLSSDYMDIYVATSMRTQADYISVNEFIEKLFIQDEVKSYKLRYFNPTQSWIEDRVSKGLVEAIMLKRAKVNIYMAQLEDTFGKDSEASVSLGQGKTVIVYVPRLETSNNSINTEKLWKEDKVQLAKMLDDKEQLDSSIDKEAIYGDLIKKKLKELEDNDFASIIKINWANYNLEKEIEERIKKDETLKKRLLDFLRKVIAGTQEKLKLEEKDKLCEIVTAVTIRFEKRAHIFKEVHPLALQVILSSGVLNGILVVRDIKQCAKILEKVIMNKLSFKFEDDENNYRLIEIDTESTMRVISKNALIGNAFKAFYNH